MLTDARKVMDNKEHSSPSYRLLGGFAIFFGTLSALCLPFILPATRKHCIPYIPATNKQVNNVIKICLQIQRQHSRLHHGNNIPFKVCDLGSGDGRVVLELAKSGILSSGYELNTWLVVWSKLRAVLLGVNKMTQFYKKNLWRVNLKTYDVIIVFGVEEMIPEMELKLKSELKRGGTVISGRFPLRRRGEKRFGSGAESIWVSENS